MQPPCTVEIKFNISTINVIFFFGSKRTYFDNKFQLKVICIIERTFSPIVLHTDQGSVYASMAYNELIKDTNIVRSMSRAGKPTDNPVNEALNGWIKEGG